MRHRWPKDRDESLRCEALTWDCYGRATDDRCECFAHTDIGGRRLCNKHAAIHALALAYKSGDAKLILDLSVKYKSGGAIRFVERR